MCLLCDFLCYSQVGFCCVISLETVTCVCCVIIYATVNFCVSSENSSQRVTCVCCVIISATFKLVCVV